METVVRTLAHGEQNAELRIFCCEGAEDHGNLPAYRLPRNKKRLSALEKALDDFDPDVIEFHQQLRQALHISRRFPRATRVLYRHNALKPPRGLFDRWRYERRFRQIDGLIFVSDAGRREFLQDYPKQEPKTFAVPNPINVDLWRAPVDGREPLIAFAGRAMPEKGVDLICAALPAVLERHPDWRAVLMLNDWDKHAAWAEPHVAPLERFGDRGDGVEVGAAERGSRGHAACGHRPDSFGLGRTLGPDRAGGPCGGRGSDLVRARRPARSQRPARRLCR